MKRLPTYLFLFLLISISSQGQIDLTLHALSYSPDGEFVVGVGDHVVVWDAASNVIIKTITLDSLASDYKFPDAAWSPDGNRLAVAGIDDWIHVLDFSDSAASLGSVIAKFELMTFLDVRSIAWSPDGSVIVIGGDETDPRLEFWDATTYEFIRSTPYSVFAYRMAWDPDPQRNLMAVTNLYDSGTQLVNIDADAPRNDTILCGSCAPEAATLPMAWNSDGSLLALGYTNGAIFIVDPATDSAVVEMQAGEYVTELLWTSDDEQLLSLSRAGVQVWESATGRLLNAPPFLKASKIAINPINDQIFYFDAWTDKSYIVDLSTLIGSNG